MKQAVRLEGEREQIARPISSLAGESCNLATTSGRGDYGANGRVRRRSGSGPPLERRRLPLASVPHPKDATCVCVCVCVCVRARVCVCVCEAARMASCGGAKSPSASDKLHEQEQVGTAPGREVRAGGGGEAVRRCGERHGAKAKNKVLARGDERAAQLGKLRHGRVQRRLKCTAAMGGLRRDAGERA